MVTDNKYRWDFIGLSTDDKPTPATSDRVVDGSTFYCSDTSKLYVFCKDTWYEKTAAGGTYELPVASAETLGGIKVGNNLSINSETGVLSATDTTYSAFTGTDGTSAGSAGLVPAPATTDAGKYLKADGSWGTVSTGPTVVQALGSSATDVMSQNAVTSSLFASSSNNGMEAVKIGKSTYAPTTGTPTVVIGSSASGQDIAVAIGYSAYAGGSRSVAIGNDARVTLNTPNSIAIGRGAEATMSGQFDISSTRSAGNGYNSTNYRLLSGVHDPVGNHDAATKGYVDGLVGNIESALNAINNGGSN